MSGTLYLAVTRGPFHWAPDGGREPLRFTEDVEMSNSIRQGSTGATELDDKGSVEFDTWMADIDLVILSVFFPINLAD